MKSPHRGHDGNNSSATRLVLVVGDTCRVCPYRSDQSSCQPWRRGRFRDQWRRVRLTEHQWHVRGKTPLDDPPSIVLHNTSGGVSSSSAAHCVGATDDCVRRIYGRDAHHQLAPTRAFPSRQSKRMLQPDQVTPNGPSATCTSHRPSHCPLSVQQSAFPVRRSAALPNERHEQSQVSLTMPSERVQVIKSSSTAAGSRTRDSLSTSISSFIRSTLRPRLYCSASATRSGRENPPK